MHPVYLRHQNPKKKCKTVNNYRTAGKKSPPSTPIAISGSIEPAAEGGISEL